LLLKLFGGWRGLAEAGGLAVSFPLVTCQKLGNVYLNPTSAPPQIFFYFRGVRAAPLKNKISA
jgi:hypothetical protein